jgi:hypothetical protein
MPTATENRGRASETRLPAALLDLSIHIDEAGAALSNAGLVAASLSATWADRSAKMLEVVRPWPLPGSPSRVSGATCATWARDPRVRLNPGSQSGR